jgi:hypothetical protein
MSVDILQKEIPFWIKNLITQWTSVAFLGRQCSERVMGIEPTLEAWEAAVLPLNYTRTGRIEGAIIALFNTVPVALLPRQKIPM